MSLHSEIAALRAPGRAFGPQHPGVEALDRGVGLGEIVEGRVDRDDVGVPEIGGRGAARAEIARRVGDRRRRRHRAALRAACASAPLAPATVAPATTARPWTSVRREIAASGSRCSWRVIASSQCVRRPLIRPGNLRLVRSASGCESCFQFSSRLQACSRTWHYLVQRMSEALPSWPLGTIAARGGKVGDTANRSASSSACFAQITLSAGQTE